MSFTDLWRCKGCDTLPDIQVRGKNFLIECRNCKGRRVFAHSLDEVVATWNRKNDPLKKKSAFAEWIASLREFPQRVKDWLEYEITRRSFRPAPAPENDEEPEGAEADGIFVVGTSAQGDGRGAMTAE
jgi:hypothetical protein